MLKDSQSVVVASWFMKVAAIVIYVIGAIFGSLLILCPDNLAVGAEPKIISTVIITACVGTALLIKAKCMDKQWLARKNVPISDLDTVIAKQKTASKRVNIALVSITIIVIITTLASVSTSNSPKKQMENTCEEYGLENIEVSLTQYTTYSNYAFYRTTIHCDGFSSLDLESCNSFFRDVCSVDADGKIFSSDETTVYSDGKVYTSKRQEINGNNRQVIYVDGKAMDERYDESNKITCTDCGGHGSTYCYDCNGTGKKSVKFYSEGDWGYESYSSYDCTDCDGRGRIECKRCYGEGYYYDLE